MTILISYSRLLSMIFVRELIFVVQPRLCVFHLLFISLAGCRKHSEFRQNSTGATNIYMVPTLDKIWYAQQTSSREGENTCITMIIFVEVIKLNCFFRIL